jgi:uncharacterized delta-60 repeat protein
MKSTIAIFALWAFLCQNSPAQFTQQWASRYNGKGDYTDQLNSIVSDKSGNIYVSGSTVNISSNADFLTIKLNQNGDTLWKRTYDGSGHGPDEALAMTIDSVGNVYVTGYERASGGYGKNYLTIKYNPGGDTLWTRIYNYAANDNEQANSIVLDPAGNVIITGQSDSNPTTTTNDDYATVKYNSNGAELWTVRYGGTGGARDRAVKVVSDAAGNIYVTGRSSNGNNDDYVTIKYNPSGVQQWLMVYDGTYTDRATAMAIDGAGNIYVTGRSSNGVNPDIVTLKYNGSTGGQIWKVAYNRADTDIPAAIAVDAAGNAYVAGQSDADPSTNTNFDYVTIKIAAAGTQAWASIYNNTGNDDIPGDIKIDLSGNIYVTGSSDGDASSIVNNDLCTIKYNNLGLQQWVKSSNGSANANDQANVLVLDQTGNVFAAGNVQTLLSQQDGIVLKYSNAGVQAWQYVYSGTGDNTDISNDMTVDGSGNVIVAGCAVNIATDRNMRVLKLSNAGDTLWTREYSGTYSASTDEAMAVTTDAAGYIYITGHTVNNTTSSDYTTIKYTPAGDTLWTRAYNFIGASDRANDIAVDASGNVYVTGRSDSDPSAIINYDIATIKYNANGILQWTARFDGAAKQSDYGTSITIGVSGRIYVSGRTNNGNDDDAITIAYDPATGTSLWSKIYDGMQGDDRASQMVLDPNENVYISGRTSNGNDFDFLTISYSASGVQRWVNTYNGKGSGDDRAMAMVLDRANNIIVSGESDEDPSSLMINFDYATIKYGSLGDKKWETIFHTSYNGNDTPSAMAVDDSSNIYITGQCDNGLISGLDYTTIRLNPSGALNGEVSYSGSGNHADGATGAVYNNGALFITGTSTIPGSQSDIVSLKYTFTVLGLLSSSKLTDLKIYPNPFNSETTIDLSMIHFAGEKILLQVFDMQGKEMEHSSMDNFDRIILKKENMHPGSYIIKLSAGNDKVHIRKLIVQ